MASYGAFRSGLRACALLVSSLLLALLAGATVASASTIDHGPVDAGPRCSETASAGASCLLPFGAPATEPVVVTTVAMGEIQPEQLRVARPDPTVAGRWTVVAVSQDAMHWAVRPGTVGAATIVDTAVTLLPGDVLVAIDPLVRAASVPLTEFALPAGETTVGSVLTTGAPASLEPTGTITTEPDADADGYGDRSEDLCPGVARPICLAGQAEVALDAPDYVPALDPLVARWTVTNTSEGPQPFIVNYSAPTGTDRLDGPPGTVCAPGRVSNPTELFVPAAIRSPLILKLYWWLNTRSGAENVQAVTKERWGVDYPFPDGSVHCRLPVLAPGASWSGTIIGTGPFVAGQGRDVIVEALTPAATLIGGSQANGYARQTKAVTHSDPTVPSLDWAPDAIRSSGSVTRRGRLAVTVTCRAPVAGQACAITGELRAPVGGRVLAALVAPVSVTKDQTATLTFSFTRAGQRWLAAHPRTASLRAVLTSMLPRELPATRSAKIQLRRSAAFNARLRRLPRR